MAKGEKAGASLAVVLGAGYLWGALAMPEMSIGDPLGPRAFPILLGALMSILGGSLLVWPAPKGSGPTGMSLHTGLLVLLLGVYGYGIPRLGYPVATVLFMVLASRLLGERSWLSGLVLSAGMSAGIFLLFTRILDIPLPLGILERIIR
ncbi:MAG: tripartite tricarboxylate transporter TctB family protein [Thermodesulfobacteriota bacterium]